MFASLSFFFLGSKDFSYLTSLFVFESLLIFFDLTVFNYVIKKLSAIKKYSDKQDLISFFLRRLLIFSALFLAFNLFFVKIFYWDKILILENFINYKISLSFFFSLIIPFIIILRVLINYLRSIFFGFFNQELFSNIQIFTAIIKILILFIFLNNSKSLESVLCAYFFGLVLEFFLFFTFCNKFISFKFNFKKQYFKTPDYLVLFALSTILLFNIDRITLSYNPNLNVSGEYNFFKVLLSSFFILSVAYFYNLFPEISKMKSIEKIIKKKIYISYKSLNIMLASLLITIFLFIENLLVDFNINNYFNINNINSFRILLITMYFNIMGIIFYSFQIGVMFLKIPAFINCFLIIISLPLFIIFNRADDSVYTAIIYLFLVISWFFFNLFFLNKHFKIIFSKDFITSFIKNFSVVFFIIIFLLLSLYFLIYNSSKIVFYLSIIFIIFYCLKLSRKILDEYV
jgi:O-antigen/teichoic acid export membrane protein